MAIEKTTQSAVFVLGLLLVLSSTLLLVFDCDEDPLGRSDLNDGPLDDGTNEGADDAITLNYQVIRGPKGVDFYGRSVGNVGDVNGDGLDDVLVGAYRYNEKVEGPERPGNFLVLGRDDGEYDGSQLRLIPNMSTSWWYRNNRWLGDVNGDGFDDVVSRGYYTGQVSSYYNVSDHYLQVRYGGNDGLLADPDPVRFSVRPYSVNEDMWTFYAYGGVGDVNGDGFNDLCTLWHPQFAGDGRHFLHPGELRLYYGSRSGLSTEPNWTLVLDEPISSYWRNVSAIHYADINGDGFSDVLFHLFWPEDPYIAVHLGSSEGITGTSDRKVPYPQREGEHRYSHDILPPVDLNGDSYNDLLLWESTYDESENAQVRSFRTVMGNDGQRPLDVKMISTLSSPEYHPLSFDAADVNGDGLHDVIWYEYSLHDADQIDPSLPQMYMDIKMNIHFNKGGTFDNLPDFNRTIGPLYDVHGILDVDSGDFDGDGLEDLVLGLGWAETNETVIIVTGKDIDDALGVLRLGSGPRLYAGYKVYDFMVNVNPTHLYNLPNKVNLRLDPEGANVSLECGPLFGGSYFKVVTDPASYVDLRSGPIDIVVDTINNTTYANFRIWFNWTWPHEELSDCLVEMDWGGGRRQVYLREDVFSVENDLGFFGPMHVSGEWQGDLEEDSWVRAGELVNISGPVVVYEGTTDIFPPPRTCQVMLLDDDGSTAKGPISNGTPIEIGLTTDVETDLEETLTLTLTNLPGEARVVNETSFRLRVDGDLPFFMNAVPDEDNWHSRLVVTVSITADDGTTSGIVPKSLEYSFSIKGKDDFGDWVQEGLEIHPEGSGVEGQVTLGLVNGEANLIRWRAMDRVGNLGVSDELRIRVDTNNVTFSDPVPGANVWINHLKVLCGVTITDLDGSGINVSTIQFRISPRNLSQYGEWIDWDEGVQGDALVVITRVDVEFWLSTYNYIQWRAMDIAGNGYTVSPNYRLLVDELPIGFIDFEPDESVFLNRTRVECTITVLDNPGGSSVNLSSVEYRWSTGGDFSDWTIVGMDGSAPSTRFSIFIDLKEGRGNLVQFRGGDVAGNGPTESLEYRIMCDSSPPEFLSFIPLPDSKQHGPSVEVTLWLQDHLAGLDASSLKYRVRSAGSPVMGDWTPLGAVTWDDTREAYYVSLDIILQPGKDNVIQFFATDTIGNGGASPEFVVWVNSPPKAVVSRPIPIGHYDDSMNITLDANGSSDPDGDPIQCSWYIRDSSTLLGQGLTIDAVLPPGHVNVTLVVVDDDGAEDTANVQVFVEHLEPPRVEEGGDSFPWMLIVLVIILILVTAYILRQQLVNN